MQHGLPQFSLHSRIVCSRIAYSRVACSRIAGSRAHRGQLAREIWWIRGGQPTYRGVCVLHKHHHRHDPHSKSGDTVPLSAPRGQTRGQQTNSRFASVTCVSISIACAPISTALPCLCFHTPLSSWGSARPMLTRVSLGVCTTLLDLVRSHT